jgi:hypothetical protein
VPDECPNCGAPFSDRVEVDMGDRYENVFGPPPSSLFSRYLRFSPDPEAAALASGSSNVTLDVYLHARQDLERGVGGPA